MGSVQFQVMNSYNVKVEGSSTYRFSVLARRCFDRWDM